MTLIEATELTGTTHIWLWDTWPPSDCRRYDSMARREQPFTQAHAAADKLATRRRLLAETFGGDVHDWNVSSDRGGRPLAASAKQWPRVCLSAARTGNVEVFAASDGVEFGVDIETSDHPKDRLQFVASCFSRGEQRSLGHLLRRDVSVIEAWTMREAFGKGLGVGLDFPGDRWFDDAAGWRFDVSSPRPGLCLATATAPTARRIEVETKWIQPDTIETNR